MSDFNDWRLIAQARAEETYRLEKELPTVFFAGFIIGVIVTVAVFIIL